ERHLGDRYVWGGVGPHVWDCSGLTSVLWAEAGGVHIPRIAAAQQAWALPVPLEQVLPGDLVFFGRPASHVGLALGDGWMIDASSSHGRVVERRIYPGPVSFGRVRRPGMPALRSSRPVATAGHPAPPTPAPAHPTTGPRPTTGTRPVQAPTASLVTRMLRIALGRLGEPYRTDGSPAGIDDAGLITVSYRLAGGRALPDDRQRLVDLERRISGYCAHGEPPFRSAVSHGSGAGEPPRRC
ncbi:MAG TPA: C40 family peptidase, partial [Mycobacteriales bacterium]|nr:C40 family peptidase [Mycobacteriales bacterium]